jgi:hypothetical protein
VGLAAIAAVLNNIAGVATITSDTRVLFNILTSFKNKLQGSYKILSLG